MKKTAWKIFIIFTQTNNRLRQLFWVGLQDNRHTLFYKNHYTLVIYVETLYISSFRVYVEIIFQTHVNDYYKLIKCNDFRVGGFLTLLVLDEDLVVAHT